MTLVELQECIDKLGATQAEVADKLRSMGIKGEAKMSRACPIAEYLKREGCPDPLVGAFSAFENAEDGTTFVRLPDHIRDFTRAFDMGLYPELKK
jgi:hypothetical protein